MASSKYTKLVKNTAIFAIGSFSTKILSFLIVPLYTYVLSTEEYGRIDLFISTISFLLPVLTMSVQEAMIRYLLGKEIDEHTAISNCWMVFLTGSVVSVCMFPLFRMFFKQTEVTAFFYATLLVESFNRTFTYYLRAVGKNVAFTVKGIVETVCLLSLNLLFLVVFRRGVTGYLCSLLLSQSVGAIYLLSVGKLWNKLNFKSVNRVWLKRMLLFSIPLIPNSLMWWVMSAGDKYIINYFMGDSANGIYAMSLKIPTIINMLYSIFYQAWQMSAIEENRGEERKQFYETVYKLSNALLAVLIACVIVGAKPLYVSILSERFAPAWSYVPVLAVATAFNCQSSFFGVVYSTSEKTKKAFLTTMIGAVLNLLFNFILIIPFGLHGVTIGTYLGYVGVALARARDAKKEIGMRFDIERTVLAVAILSLQAIVTVSAGNLPIALAGVLSISLIAVLYKPEIFAIVEKALGIAKKS